ncbi:MAG: Glycerol-3-phosphate acyltransferase [candidate division TM6 bacterium GW2011_GWF2_32_72]|nr:MAG: Glycerol-3-phosphate acyltransferase [candidate division TM6 bacterium GW2011_GWF2_32_72]
MILIYDFLILIFAYLIGSLPVGYWITKSKDGADIRKFGSGNIGATNVGRKFGVKYFFLVMSLDALKAFLLMWLVVELSSLDLLDPFIVFVAIVALLVGNGYSIFLNFSGGKGIATSLGILMVLSPKIALGMVLLWCATFIFTKNAGWASIVTIFMLMIVAVTIVHQNIFLCFSFTFISLWCLFRHKQNILDWFNKKSL